MIANPDIIEKERVLLGDLGEALECGEPNAIERARRELREFYRSLGMHP